MIDKYKKIFPARIDEIEVCLKNKCYIAALALTLTLPDICGKAEYPGVGPGKRYIQWCDQYIDLYKGAHSSYDVELQESII